MQCEIQIFGGRSDEPAVAGYENFGLRLLFVALLGKNANLERSDKR